MGSVNNNAGAQPARYYRSGDVLEVTIEKIVPRGFGLGFAENLTVLVPLAVPGDLLEVRIREKKKRMAFAEIVKVLRPGHERSTPPCPLFGVCGGCDFQQMNYAAQVEAKRGIIRDCLVRIGKIEVTDDDITMIASPHPLEYRSRARWHFDKANQRIGYMRRDSNEVVDVAACPILTPGLVSTLEFLRESTDWNSYHGDVELEAASGEAGRVSTFSRAAREAAAIVSVRLAGEEYSYSAETFFQANRFLIERLIESAIGDAAGESALDLYSGVGLFALALARRFSRVTAVEENGAAVELAQMNIANAHLENVQVLHKGVEKHLSRRKKITADFVLLDPPRSGTEPRTIELLTRVRPRHISYVSCEPSILARDLRLLLDAGYRIESITGIDLFPQTHHVETVVHLRNAGTSEQ
ncbi:MAG: class I SAM-dependent RNA methyltransferase [Acidobacteria bacterium]|nr:class I SAM-dependent RNA methyltransferase [Acidobacteriota bacterium]